MDELAKLAKVALEMDAGAIKRIIRKTDGTILQIVCLYTQSDDLPQFLEDLEELEERYGYGT